MCYYYLIRLDDACPTMSRTQWERMEEILDKYAIKPMVGVVPHNEDPALIYDEEDANFWDKVRRWEQKGWAISLHGYNHSYTSMLGKSGLNPMWARSEFAGIPIDEQRSKIRKGLMIMREHGVFPKYFFAPSHTFDENTLLALREESSIRIVSDTISTQPYRYKDFIFIPQFSGQCRRIIFPGSFTFCLHPNTMKDEDFKHVDLFLNKYSNRVISFDLIPTDTVRVKSVFDRLLCLGYFTLRKIKSNR